MPVNTNAQAIAFANTRARPMADVLESAYLSAKKLVGEWNAQATSAVIPNDATYIDDGAAPVGSGTAKTPDGRPPCKDSDANSLVTRCLDYITWYEGGSSPTVTGGGTMGVANTVRAIEVNGRTEF